MKEWILVIATVTMCLVFSISMSQMPNIFKGGVRTTQEKLNIRVSELEKSVVDLYTKLHSVEMSPNFEFKNSL